jgi:hypothetical protein
MRTYLPWAIRVGILILLFISDRVLHLWPSTGATYAYAVVVGLLVVQGWSVVKTPRQNSPSSAAGRFLAVLAVFGLVTSTRSAGMKDIDAQTPAVAKGLNAQTAAVAKSATPVTFSSDVAPIIFSHCTSCHRPGEAAPFTLMNYDDVKTRAKLIAAVTRSRRMPPWKAGPGDYAFDNERSLTDADIATFERWADTGALEGDPSRLPPRPSFTEGWELGKPDLVVTMDEAYEVPADGPDIYRNFVLPLNLTEDKWVRAVDFRPSARSVVHHSLFFLDDTGAAREADARDPGPGYNGAMGGNVGVVGLLRGRGAGRGRSRGATGGDGPPAPGAAIGRATSGGLGGWAVGARARALPEGLAYFVSKESDLVLSTHFHPSGKLERETSSVGLYFTDTPPNKRFMGVQLPPLFGVFAGINIPADEKHFTVSDQFVLPVDVEAFAVSAHAHYLAKEMKLTATPPDGETKTLLWIRDWDFSWQEQYQYTQFVSLPAGTRLEVSISYDNSADNPRNPSHPPAKVMWGEQSTDEMGSMTLQIVAKNEGDLPRLRQAFTQHLREAALKSPDLGRLIQMFAPRLQQR